MGIPEPDAVIECVGSGETMESAIELVGPCGTVMLFGLAPPDCRISISPFQIFLKEIHVTASFINPYTIGRAIGILESGRVDVKSLIAHRLPLEELKRALDDGKLRADGKVVIVP